MPKTGGSRIAKPHNGHQAKNEAAKSASVPNAVAVVKRSPRAKPSQSLQPLVVSVPVAQRMLGDIDRKSVTALIDEGILKVRRLSTLPRCETINRRFIDPRLRQRRNRNALMEAQQHNGWAMPEGPSISGWWSGGVGHSIFG